MIFQNRTLLSFLFLLGMFLVCGDIFSINAGGLNVKIAYPVFVIYVLAFALMYGLELDRKNLAISMAFLISLTPSVVFSTNAKVSIAFLVGAIMCVVMMMTFARMAEILGEKTFDLLLWFYRATITVTFFLVLARIQTRGHFFFYEPSYWAISLIPYFCITAYRQSLHGLRHAGLDLLLIVLAVALSQSVSMALWLVASFFAVYLAGGKIKLKYFIWMIICVALFILIAAQIHERTKAIVSEIPAALENPDNALSLLIFVVGNRVQRLLVAYNAFVEHPLFGVGIGALKSYASAFFTEDDFLLNGMSATDFTTELNATNIYLEMAAEGGISGLIGFMILLKYVHKRAGRYELTASLKFAFVISMISLLIESSYLRTYVWALYGIILGLSTKKQEAPQANCSLPNGTPEPDFQRT
jgi:O-antigen ligase